MANSLLTPHMFACMVMYAAQKGVFPTARNTESIAQWSVNDMGTVWIITLYDLNRTLLWRHIFTPDEVFTVSQFHPAEVEQWLQQRYPDIFKPRVDPTATAFEAIDKLLTEVRELHTKSGELLGYALTQLAELGEKVITHG